MLFQAGSTFGFCAFDEDGDSLLSADELQLMSLKTANKDAIFSQKITSEQAVCISKNIIRDFDFDDDGKMNLKEYLELETAQSAPQVLFFKSFKSF